jgi:UDP-glucuronate decarboxylase
MKIVIAGGAGFIGTNLSLALPSFGHEVVCLDNFCCGQYKREQLIDPSIECLEFDLASLPPYGYGDSVKATNALKQADVVINLACPASPPFYQSWPISTMDVCYLGTKLLLDNALQLKENFNKNQIVIHASTSEIYGDPLQSPQTEHYYGNVNTMGLRSCYDEGKRIAETLCFEYARSGVDVRVMRIFNTYGPFMRADDGRVVSNFINQALKGEPLTVYGDGSQTRSLMYIDDLINAIMHIINAPIEKIGHAPINLGNPDERTVLGIAKMIISIAGKNNLEIISKPLPMNDPRRRCPEISRAKQVLGWEPKVDTLSGLYSTYKYFKSIL